VPQKFTIDTLHWRKRLGKISWFTVASPLHKDIKRNAITNLAIQNTSASARISKGAVLAKKGQFASYKEKLEKWTEFHYF
jgi:hypothetical protein